MTSRRGKVHFTAYLTSEILAEVLVEAERQQRPVGWIIRRAVKIALPRIRKFTP